MCISILYSVKNNTNGIYCYYLVISEVTYLGSMGEPQEDGKSSEIVHRTVWVHAHTVLPCRQTRGVPLSALLWWWPSQQDRLSKRPREPSHHEPSLPLLLWSTVLLKPWTSLPEEPTLCLSGQRMAVDRSRDRGGTHKTELYNPGTKAAAHREAWSQMGREAGRAGRGLKARSWEVGTSSTPATTFQWES